MRLKVLNNTTLLDEEAPTSVGGTNGQVIPTDVSFLPGRAFKIPKRVTKDVLNELKPFLDATRYPDLILNNDTVWCRGKFSVALSGSRKRGGPNVYTVFNNGIEYVKQGNTGGFWEMCHDLELNKPRFDYKANGYIRSDKNPIEYDRIIKGSYSPTVQGTTTVSSASTSTKSASFEDPVSKLLSFKTDDYQNRQGEYPRSGVPDSIDIYKSNKGNNRYVVEAEFKNTSEGTAKSWLSRWLSLKGYSNSYSDLEAYQSPDSEYKDDWVTASAIIDLGGISTSTSPSTSVPKVPKVVKVSNQNNQTNKDFDFIDPRGHSEFVPRLAYGFNDVSLDHVPHDLTFQWINYLNKEFNLGLGKVNSKENTIPLSSVNKLYNVLSDTSLGRKTKIVQLINNDSFIDLKSGTVITLLRALVNPYRGTSLNGSFEVLLTILTGSKGTISATLQLSDKGYSNSLYDEIKKYEDRVSSGELKPYNKAFSDIASGVLPDEVINHQSSTRKSNSQVKAESVVNIVKSLGNIKAAYYDDKGNYADNPNDYFAKVRVELQSNYNNNPVTTVYIDTIKKQYHIHAYSGGFKSISDHTNYLNDVIKIYSKLVSTGFKDDGESSY